MNRSATSRQEIVKAGLELVASHGWKAVGIRDLAKGLGVASGTIYHYFSSKSALSAALVEEVWKEVFRHEGAPFDDTVACLEWAFSRIEWARKEHPGFISLHSSLFLEDGNEEGRELMHRTWEHMKSGLCAVMEKDARIRAQAFDGDLGMEDYADIMLSLILAQTLRPSMGMHAIRALVERTLY